MKKIYISFLLLLSVSLLQAQIDRSVQPTPGPAPKVNLQKPQTFTLDNGLTVMVVENHKLPRVTFSLGLDNPPTLEGEIKGVDNLASSMMGNGTSKIDKDEFNEQIDYYGASVGFSVGGVSGTALSRYFPQVLSLAAQGALDPKFTEEDLESEREKILAGLKAEEKNTRAIASKVYRTLLYGKNHPNGEQLTEETVKRVTLDDVKNYYQTNFVPENAYLVVVGDVKFNEVKKLVTENFSGWKKSSVPRSNYKDPVNLPVTEINVIDIPNAVQSDIYIGSVVDLKMTNPDFFAASLANYILGGGADSRLFMNIREDKGWTYGAMSSLRGSKYVGDFSANAAVRNSVTDSAVVEMLKEVEKIRTTLPTAEELELAKAKYIGDFVMNAEKPETVANFALREKTQSLPSDYYENYIKNVNNVTLQQVQDAAKKYITADGLRIVVVGKALDYLPALENLNIPINYYDKAGNPTSKPEAVALDATLTPQVVLEKYIDAIGGKQAIENVKTLMVTATATIEGNEMTLVKKETNDGKSYQEMSIMGMTLSKAVYDGKEGYVIVNGQRKDFDEAELEEMKYSGYVAELLLLHSDIKLIGVEDNNYVLELDNRKFYYDINTGLKTSESIIKELAPGQTMEQRSYSEDYREINGIKVPYKTLVSAGGMEFEFTVTDVKVNEGVSEEDFK